VNSTQPRSARQVALQQHVVGVVAGIAFVAAEIDGAADADRQVGVDLDEAGVIALIIIVAGPALAGDELQVKRSPAGAGCARRCGAALGDGGANTGSSRSLGMVKRFWKASTRSASGPGRAPASRSARAPDRSRKAASARADAEQALRLLGEAQLLALRSSAGGSRGGELGEQEGAAAALHRIEAGGAMARRAQRESASAAAPGESSAAGAAPPWPPPAIRAGRNKRRYSRARARRSRAVIWT
jgi:hypothetical protein